MIEDALKSARNLHRLIMTVSLVTIVFALSITPLKREGVWLRAIEDFLENDFTTYPAFVSARLDTHELEELSPIADELAAFLENEPSLVFGKSALADAFRSTPHIGRVQTEDTILSDVASASLVQLEALNGLSLGRNVQIVVPKIEELMSDLEEFFAANASTGASIDDIRIGLSGDDFFVAETFLPDQQTYISIYFELLSTGTFTGAPVFNGTYEAVVIEIDGASVLDWMKSAPRPIGFRIDDGVSWHPLPELSEIDKGDREKALSLVASQYRARIAAKGPEEQSVSILGTTVPGILVALASPLTLIALSYYLAQHTRHLTRLATPGADSFVHFAWLPLSLEAVRVLPLGPFRVAWWRVEVLVTVTVLPFGATVLLADRLARFEPLAMGLLSLMLGALIATVLFGRQTLGHIAAVRGLIR